MTINVNINTRTAATVATVLIGGSFFMFKLVALVAAFQNAVG